MRAHGRVWESEGSGVEWRRLAKCMAAFGATKWVKQVSPGGGVRAATFSTHTHTQTHSVTW